MYSLDINFLKDRNLGSESAGAIDKPSASRSSAPPGQEPAPLIVGGVVAGVCVAIAGLMFLQANQAKANTQAEIDSVTGEIQQIDQLNAKIVTLENNVKTLEDQSKAFVDVLQTKIKPWSAILGEVSDLAPPGLQVNSFIQTENTVVVMGYARNYIDVNDFVLNLQASPLFVEDDVFIVKAALVDNPAVLEFSKPVESYTLPKVVEYEISLTLGDLTNAEIIKTLESQGARGMAERLKKSF
jgi:type IV pilus assembly protein PilN